MTATQKVNNFRTIIKNEILFFLVLVSHLLRAHTHTHTLSASALSRLVEASQLRSNTHKDALSKKAQHQRHLQGINGLLNSLINIFTPTMGDYIKEELAVFDPIDFGNETTVDLGTTDFDGACPSQANITYGLGELSGLTDVTINRIELVENSQDIDMSFLGLDGATWKGEWIIEMSFEQIMADTTVGLVASLCGFPISQTLQGIATIGNPSLALTIQIEGETSNLLQFSDSSQVTSAVVQNMELEVSSVDVVFAMQGNVIQNLNITEGLEAMVLNQLSNDIEPLFISVVNSFLAADAPFNLGGNDNVVSRNGGHI